VKSFVAARSPAAIGLISATVLCGAVVMAAERAAADTDPTALVGEGGSFLTPVTNLLLNSDSGLAPLNPQYTDSNIDNAISDFVGSGPGQFSADFVVSERPLTSDEAKTASSNGRTFAYVPFAATPVAIAVFAVCNESNLTTNTITPTTFCNDMPLTPALLGGIFTHGLTTSDASLPQSLSGWSDTRLTQKDGSAIPDPNGIGQASTLLPSAESYALMSLLDSDPTAKAEFDNALNNPAITPASNKDTPSEIWPFHTIHSYVGGDEGLLGKELNIEATTNAPSYLDSWGALSPNEGNAHDAFPVSAVWTGEPEGVQWNVPTAAIQNAAGKFVGPTVAAASAAESGSAQTLDPATNLVTFNADPTDSAAYNNYLMAESYLVVPTSSLASQKAIKLAQFIRYVLGPKAQADMEILGSAPATSAEVTAGLKVASELDAEAGGSGSTSSSSTSTTTSSVPGGSLTSSGASASTGAEASSGSNGNAVGDSGGQGGLPTLALTGSNPWLLGGLGLALVLGAEPFRRALRRKRRTG
jgi:ABC-type phosphate transport system substrate-binding protein